MLTQDAISAMGALQGGGSLVALSLLLIIVGVVLAPLLLRRLDLLGILCSILLLSGLCIYRASGPIPAEPFVSASSAHLGRLLSIASLLVHQVFLGVLVTVLASFDIPVGPSHEVLDESHRFKVIWVAAGPVATQVVNNKSIHNGSNEDHVRGSVYKHPISPSNSEPSHLVSIDRGFLWPAPAPSYGVYRNATEYILLGESVVLHAANIIKSTA